MNSFGSKYTFTSFGESHGNAIGGVLDGVPSNMVIDMETIRYNLERRAGAKGGIGGESSRAKHEKDEVEWLSGVIERKGSNGKAELVTLGSPIAFIIRNTDSRPADYELLKENYRVGHADKVYEMKYGIRDYRGGGRSSARETASRVVAGTVIQQILERHGIEIHAELIQVGTEKNPQKFKEVITSIQKEGDSIGGIVRCTIKGLPACTGDPIFDKLQSHLAYAMMSINACKGFDYGTGFEGIGMKGSEANHISGGISGGISDGSDITFRCVFKPTASISKLYKGRHDVCVASRAVPVVEAMTALAIGNIIL